MVEIDVRIIMLVNTCKQGGSEVERGVCVCVCCACACVCVCVCVRACGELCGVGVLRVQTCTHTHT